MTTRQSLLTVTLAVLTGFLAVTLRGQAPPDHLDLVDANAVMQGLRDGENPQRRRVAQLFAHVVETEGAGIDAAYADVQHPDRFLNHFRKGAADERRAGDPGI